MADKYRFYAVKQANEEIARLEKIVAERDETLTAAQERITTLEAGNNPKLAEDLKAAQDSLVALQIKADAGEKDLSDLRAKLASAEAKVAAAEKNASSQALAIVAAQGVPPVTALPTATPAADRPKGIGSDLTGLERAIAAHKASYSAK